MPMKVKFGFLDREQINFFILDVILKRYIVFMFFIKLMSLQGIIGSIYAYYPLLIFEIIGYIGVKIMRSTLVWACILINCQSAILIFSYISFGIPTLMKVNPASFAIYTGIWILYIFLMVLYVNKLKKFSEESIRNMKEAMKECKLYIQY